MRRPARMLKIAARRPQGTAGGAALSAKGISIITHGNTPAVALPSRSLQRWLGTLAKQERLVLEGAGREVAIRLPPSCQEERHWWRLVPKQQQRTRKSALLCCVLGGDLD